MMLCKNFIIHPRLGPTAGRPNLQARCLDRTPVCGHDPHHVLVQVRDLNVALSYHFPTATRIACRRRRAPCSRTCGTSARFDVSRTALCSVRQALVTSGSGWCACSSSAKEKCEPQPITGGSFWDTVIGSSFAMQQPLKSGRRSRDAFKKYRVVI
ncbi:hypothetical protein BD413DRAFT_28484 [Trametes elegans]|nr:hypothetical protein BD413DRAFT_28484 [Trametes elegans]